MEKDLIEKHREQYPIPINEIKWYSSFQQIFGKNKNEYSNDERKQRWLKNLNELKENDNSDVVEHWTQAGGDGECCSCVHFNSDGGWCKLMGLPSTVNPVLSFNHGIIGLACGGAGIEAEGQTELDI